MITSWSQRLAAMLWLVSLVARAEPPDLVIRHGRVVDGTGSAARFADVAVRAGRIVVVGKVSETGRTEIDARGRMVAPGFIDVHTHAEDIAELPDAENFVRMGVTTIVTGNCGSSALDVAAFFHQLAATNVAVNVATLIGHNTVRTAAMGGAFDRPPTDAELAKMRTLVEQGMRAGAVGFSTGLIYLPGTFTKTEEIIDLTRRVAPFGGIYATHMRDEGLKIFDSLAEVFRIAREAGVPAEISHLKLAGPASWGQTAQVLAAIERARAEGLDITQDEYVYAASSTGIGSILPDSAREGGKFAERLAQPAVKAQVIAELKAKLQRNGRADYAYVTIAACPADSKLNGLTLPQAAKLRRGSEALDEQIELLFELELHGGATGIFFGIDERDLQAFLAHPNTMIASDSGVRRFQEGAPHPRGYGNNARVLARYVRELKVLRLEEAVRRMTSLPAATFRLRDRGLVRVGSWADLVVFDPATVQDDATFASPHHYARGIDDVLVNGVPVVRAGQPTRARPGQPLRLNQERAE